MDVFRTILETALGQKLPPEIGSLLEEAKGTFARAKAGPVLTPEMLVEIAPYLDDLNRRELLFLCAQLLRKTLDVIERQADEGQKP
jgi:hypothetical protein